MENQDAEDAARWRALLGCKRIRLLGYARGGPKGDTGPIRHIGFEFTTDAGQRNSAESVLGARTLTEFVDALVKAQA